VAELRRLYDADGNAQTRITHEGDPISHTCDTLNRLTELWGHNPYFFPVTKCVSP
jgi:hypothetical protein